MCVCGSPPNIFLKPIMSCQHTAAISAFIRLQIIENFYSNIS